VSGARALFAGPAACRALVGGAAGAVEIVFGAGAYVRVEDEWLLLASPAAPFGPLSVAIADLDRVEIAPTLPVREDRRRLILGDQAVSLERMRARPPALPVCGSRMQRGAVAAAAASALALLPEPAAVLRPGIAALQASSLADGVRSLAGLGEGLTPAGDDVLAGYAAWCALGGRRCSAAPPAARAPLSALAASRASPLGLAYLRCAERGEVPDAGARLLAAVRRGSPAAVAASLRGLRSWGASSGIAFAIGVAVAAARQPSAGAAYA
jgi:Protein of unknown function (DUF2877)